MARQTPALFREIGSRILVLRGQKVLIDADLAELYGVTTKVLNQAVKRNRKRFPNDFMFQLKAREKAEVVTNCDHLRKLKYAATRPYAFTEHGAIQAANALHSVRAVEMSVYVVRAFVRLRETLAAHKELAAKLEALEQTVASLGIKHDTLATDARIQFQQVFVAIRQLMTPPPAPRKRPIGFVTPAD